MRSRMLVASALAALVSTVMPTAGRASMLSSSGFGPVAPLAGIERPPMSLAEPQPGPVRYVLPVQRAVVDPFRSPETPWGPGNRGWEFASVVGETVVAVGPGSVVFAGFVAGRAAVTVAHPDGLLSSVTGLSRVAVMRGDLVVAGTPLGTATSGLHLGFRRDGAYIDPALVYRRPLHAVLVPLPR